MKNKIHFVCQSCGASSPKWLGRCSQCQQWNSLIEEIAPTASEKRAIKTVVSSHAPSLDEIANLPREAKETERMVAGLAEFDRVLGGGMVRDSVILLGGPPGVGKSTLLLQILHKIPTPTLYLTAEESVDQVASRAKRLGMGNSRLIRVVSLNDVLAAIQHIEQNKPSVVVLDSLQTFYDPQLESAPGSVSQVREVAHRLVQYCKNNRVVLFLIGQINKEGMLAGPKVVEHLVDVVLHFDSDTNDDLRFIRAQKNRFGSIAEVGIFEMRDTGLVEPTELLQRFLSKDRGQAPGSIATVQLTGTRSIICEIQALCVQTPFGLPRRTAIGIDPNRLAMLLAVLDRHAGIQTFQYDVFVNVVGGMRLSDTSSDLAVLLAIVSSLNKKTLSAFDVALGEVGLTGEIRSIQRLEQRIEEAKRMNFERIFTPPVSAHSPKSKTVVPVRHIQELIRAVF